MLNRITLLAVGLMVGFNAQAATQSVQSVKMDTPAAEKNWTPYYENYSYTLPTQGLDQTIGEHYVGVNFEGKENDTLGLKLAVQQVYGTNDFEALNFRFNYNKTWQLGNGWNAVSMTRVYLPLSEYLQTVGEYQGRQYIRFNRQLNNTFGFRWESHARGYVHTEDELGQKFLRLRHLIRVSAKISDFNQIWVYTGYQNDYFHGGTRFEIGKEESEWKEVPREGDRVLFLVLAPFFVGKDITIIPAAEQFHNNLAGQSFSLLKPEDTFYSLNVTVNL